MGDGITAAEANDPPGLFYQCTTLDSTTGKYVEEFSSWHGTQVSGIIGAATDNGIGMASVGRERACCRCACWPSAAAGTRTSSPA